MVGAEGGTAFVRTAVGADSGGKRSARLEQEAELERTVGAAELVCPEKGRLGLEGFSFVGECDARRAGGVSLDGVGSRWLGCRRRGRLGFGGCVDLDQRGEKPAALPAIVRVTRATSAVC